LVNAISGPILAKSAIRCCFVETELDPEVPMGYPFSGSVFPAAPSLQWVPRIGSPPSRLLRAAPTPCHSSRLASFPSFGSTIACSIVRSWTDRHPSIQARVLWVVASPTTMFDGNGRASQVPDGPPRMHALLSDPGGTIGSGHCNPLVRPSAYWTASASATKTFRGSITRPAFSLSTLRRVGCPSPRKTRFWLLASFARWVWSPTGSRCEVSV